MSQRTLLHAIFFLFIAHAYAQTPTSENKKTGLDKVYDAANTVGDVYKTGTDIYSKGKPVFDAIGNGTSVLKGLAQMGASGSTTKHAAFPQCAIQPTFPQNLNACIMPQSTDSKVIETAKATNQNILKLLMIQRDKYEMGTAEIDNHGNNTNGIACLNQRINDINVDFKKIDESLDNSITTWKVEHAKFKEAMEAEKEKLTEDYNTLFTGKNNKFSPVNEILATPGCESMFDQTGITDSYENAKDGGLIGIKKSQKDRTTDATTFLKNSALIEKDVNITLNQLEKNLRNTSMKDLTDSKGTINKTLKDQTTDLSQFNIKDNPTFVNSLDTAITDMRSKRQGIVNNFREYLTDADDQSFMTSLLEGGDADNKAALFTSWQNNKKLNCIYKELGSSEATIRKTLMGMVAPQDSRMDTKCNKSCQDFINKSITILTDSNDGKTLEEKLSRLSANNSVSANQVYTLRSPLNPASKVSLAQLMRNYSASCQKSMALNKKSYDFIVSKIMAPAIKELANHDKNLRNEIMARMRNEIRDCNGKASNFDACSNVLPSKPGQKTGSPFCFQQARSCSGNISQCTSTLNRIIDTKTKSMTNIANNINVQVKAFKATMQKDLLTKMDQISKTKEITLNIPALSSYAGYKSKANSYKFDEDKNKDGFYYKDFEKLQEPPHNIKVEDPENAITQYVDNMEKIRTTYDEMKEAIMAKMKEDIVKIQKNYTDSIARIDKELKSCGELSKAIEDKVVKSQDACVKKAEESVFDDLIEALEDTTPDAICNDLNEPNSKVAKFRKCKDAASYISKLITKCDTRKNRLSDYENLVANAEEKDKAKEELQLKKEKNSDEEKISDAFSKIEEKLKTCISSDVEVKCSAITDGLSEIKKNDVSKVVKKKYQIEAKEE